MKRLIVAVCVGAAAALAGLLVGLNQPGSWLAELVGRPTRGYDIFIHDHYFIVRPAIVLINLVSFTFVASAVLRQLSRGQNRGAGA
jgi:hypothetical protein